MAKYVAFYSNHPDAISRTNHDAQAQKAIISGYLQKHSPSENPICDEIWEEAVDIHRDGRVAAIKQSIAKRASIIVYDLPVLGNSIKDIAQLFRRNWSLFRAHEFVNFSVFAIRLRHKMPLSIEIQSLIYMQEFEYEMRSFIQKQIAHKSSTKDNKRKAKFSFDVKIGSQVASEMARKIREKVSPLIIELHEEGKSSTFIADMLNTAGFETAHGKEWSGSSVRNIIKSIKKQD